MIFYDFEVFRYDWLVVVGDGEAQSVLQAAQPGYLGWL